jgi:hypothetical protein
MYFRVRIYVSNIYNELKNTLLLCFIVVAMQEENGGADGRIVVAFRGTQLGTTIDCIVDLCMDASMWVLPNDCVPNPPKCALFDNATLDYFSQAVEYTLKVILYAFLSQFVLDILQLSHTYRCTFLTM